MLDYEYLTEHEPIDEVWNEEEIEAIEELNAIFNL